MTGTARSAEMLEQIGRAEELEIAPRRSDGSLLGPRAIWVVRVGDELYVRSWRGQGGSWYRAARDDAQAHSRRRRRLSEWSTGI